MIRDMNYRRGQAARHKARDRRNIPLASRPLRKQTRRTSKSQAIREQFDA